MTHFVNPLIVFEEQAATLMENGLELLSLFGKPEGTARFPEELPEVHFLGFRAGARFQKFLEGFWKVYQK